MYDVFWIFLGTIAFTVLMLVVGLLRIRYGEGEPRWALLACACAWCMLLGPEIGVALALTAKRLKEDARRGRFRA